MHELDSKISLSIYYNRVTVSTYYKDEVTLKLIY